MKKWEVEISFTIQAETRDEAWKEARELIERKLRGLASVERVGLHPIGNPDEWIAINEPIKA